VAVIIAYFSRGRWAAVAGLVPMVMIIAALQAFVTPLPGSALSISFFLGIAIGPLVADLFSIASPVARDSMRQHTRRTFFLAPDVKGWKGYFPNPFKVLDRRQAASTAAAAGVSSLTFVVSPVAMTVMLGEVVGARARHAYHRLTSMMAVKNGVTESTWVVRRLSQEAIIGTFAGLILVISVYEGGILGLLVAVAIGIFGGLMNKLLGMHAGVQFMAYYTATLFIPKLLA
jgi:hypothetical protein